MKRTGKVNARRALGTVAALALIGGAGWSQTGALADPAETMAPPVQAGDSTVYQTDGYDSGNYDSGYSQSGRYDSGDYDSGDYDSSDYASGNYDPAGYNAPPANEGAARDSVFNWREVPADQRVPLRRAVFDRGGYQLYDAAGETIVVPFTNHNLYVMKFAPSPDGTLYFVNDGDAPLLYVPRGAYLENAAVPGARWYPFPHDFRTSQPVFLGIAPSWDDFCGMGWYPRMVFYGGYWGRSSFLEGGLFAPTIGLSIFIGGHPYYGWEPYHDYYRYHEAPYHVTVVNQNIYRFGGHDNGDRGGFRGTGRSYESNRSFGSHSFGGRPTGPIGGGRTFDGRSFGENRTFDARRDGARPLGGGRTFQGGSRAYTSGSGQPYYGHSNFPGGREFQGARSSSSAPVFQGRSYSGDRTSYNSGDRAYANPGGRGFSQRPFPGSQEGGTSPRAFGGGRSYPEATHSYPAAGRPSGDSARPADRPSLGERRYAGGNAPRSGDRR